MKNKDQVEIEKLVKEENWRELGSVIYFLSLYCDDYDFVFNVCCRFSNHKNENVRGNAILGFGHIAIGHGKIDFKIVLPIIEKAKSDPSEHVRFKANDAIDDMEFLLDSEKNQ